MVKYIHAFMFGKCVWFPAADENIETWKKSEYVEMKYEN